MLLLVGVGVCVLLAVAYLLNKMLVFDDIPTIVVPTTKFETEDDLHADVYDPSKQSPEGTIPCFDPSTMKYLGTMPAMTAKEVTERVERAWVAAETWRTSSFDQRRQVLKILLKYIVNNQDTICRVASRDSGKSMLDAVFGEIINTCEKLYWLIGEGEACLKPQNRSAGIMMFYKAPRLEFVPLGVIGAIVPWNYPFHNVLNPVSAAIMAGNSIVVKVSEHASWSAKFYGAVILKALEAAGAPRDLVQIVTGYGEAGHALASAKLGKLIFVGSTSVGRAVMKSCVDRLTPLTLELGGKDAILVCDDCDFDHTVQTSLRGAFQASGANCVGAERFIVQSSIYNKFVDKLVSIIKQMKQGPPLAGSIVDTGAICLPGLAEKIHELVEDAVSNGAKIAVGGIKNTAVGQYYPPTVITNVSRDMRIWKEEVFGPVMVVVSFETDDECVKMANDCAFGLGSNVFSKNPARARKIASQIEAGMTSINDFASTYMSQSLPFGGLKESGFGRFGGIEGLRALCSMKSIAEDRFPWLMTTDIPPILQYPIKPGSLSFVSGLVKMFYAPGLKQRALGIIAILKAIMSPSKPKEI